MVALGALLIVLLGGSAIYLAQLTPAPTEAQFLQGLEPSAITISVDRIRGSKASGSGFFISQDGLALTNAHVLVGALTASGSTLNGNQSAVQLVGIDKADDIAELQLVGVHTSLALRLAGSAPQLGQDVYAIGNPLGALPGTITKGHVSGLDRQLTVHGIQYQHLVQVDVSVSPGNSGGPVIDSSGAVIGMLTLGTAATNQAFAIPASTLMASVTQWRGLAPTDIPFPMVTAPSDEVLISQQDVISFVVSRPGTGLISGYAGPVALTSTGSSASAPFARTWLQVFPNVQAAQAEFKKLSAPPAQPFAQKIEYRPLPVPTVADESEFHSANILGNRIEGVWRDRNVVVLILVYSLGQTASDGLIAIVQAQQQRIDDY